MLSYLTTILYFLVVPLTWIVVPLVLAVRAKSLESCRRWLLLAAGLLIFLTNKPISSYSYYLWEVPRVHDSGLERYDAAVVLTGSGTNRLSHPVTLWRQGRLRRIIISGGSGDQGHSARLSEAAVLHEVLRTYGVPDSVVVLEERSSNTHQNALFTAELLRTQPAMAPHGRLLLVTSAHHMRRAAACFRKAGLSPSLFPTENAGRAFSLSLVRMTPTVNALLGWEHLMREIAGYVAYRLVGYC